MTTELKQSPLTIALFTAADEVEGCGGNEAEIMRLAATRIMKQSKELASLADSLDGSEFCRKEAESKLAQINDQKPFGCLYGKNNGDGTYSPDFWPKYPLPDYITPHKDYPITPLYAVPVVSDFDKVLPCDVQLPGVKFGRGVKVSTLMTALKQRERWPKNQTRLKITSVASEAETIKRFREALEASRQAFDDLFAHCLSNGVFNAWQKSMDCTSINEAMGLINRALSGKDAT